MNLHTILCTMISVFLVCLYFAEPKLDQGLIALTACLTTAILAHLGDDEEEGEE